MPIEPELVADTGKRGSEPRSTDALRSVAGGGGPQVADVKVSGTKGTAAGIGAVSPSGGGAPKPADDKGDGIADLVVGSTPSQPRRP